MLPGSGESSPDELCSVSRKREPIRVEDSPAAGSVVVPGHRGRPCTIAKRSGCRSPARPFRPGRGRVTMNLLVRTLIRRMRLDQLSDRTRRSASGRLVAGHIAAARSARRPEALLAPVGLRKGTWRRSPRRTAPMCSRAATTTGTTTSRRPVGRRARRSSESITCRHAPYDHFEGAALLWPSLGDYLDERVDLRLEWLAELREHPVLYDRDKHGELLHPAARGTGGQLPGRAVRRRGVPPAKTSVRTTRSHDRRPGNPFPGRFSSTPSLSLARKTRWPVVKNGPDTFLFGRLPPPPRRSPVTGRLRRVRVPGAFTTFRQPP